MKIVATLALACAITATADESPNNRGLRTAAEAADAGFTKYFDQAAFSAQFPGAAALYKFDGLVEAAKKYPEFANSGSEVNDKRELAAFLAEAAHECDNFKAAEEYAKDTYPESKYCKPDAGPCAAGHRYHGRGPIQLSWNFNYIAAGKALGLDLLNSPETVGTDSAAAWQTALWFWMTPQKGGKIIHNVVTQEDGFAQATDIINGGEECGPAAPHKEKEAQRIENYKKMCAALGVQPGSKMSCNQFVNASLKHFRKHDDDNGTTHHHNVVSAVMPAKTVAPTPTPTRAPTTAPPTMAPPAKRDPKTLSEGQWTVDEVRQQGG
ncbi:TPA: hypothetical protein N0F65_001245 [Lagenidium giganteum]|uniref:Glycoside hydrolase family 19 catalytic domain-containing protein n=1 Tax=Lagenidium giganteum TaxID=4803 RepID=A0AAV2YTL8_9STRA|nr:TPA: hypothetical protein N0F65_001245 [Lagenidium giganteum]